MRLVVTLCLALLAAHASAAQSPVLAYTLVGLEGPLLENAQAWLGDVPTTVQQRLNFVVTARERIEGSLQALGYYHARVKTEVMRTEPTWQLTLRVEPGTPVLIASIDIELTGAAAEDPEFSRLVAAVPFAKGDVLNHGSYDRFKNKFLSLAQQRGYFQAAYRVRRVAVNTAADTAAIQLHFDSGPRYRFGPVSHSATVIDEELLKSLQPFREGDYFDQAKLSLFQGQLQRTRYFSSVVLRPEPQLATDLRVPLVLTLHPARRHSFDAGIGYSTDTRERVSLTWRTPRINHLGHSQETRIAYSAINPSGRFTYTIPLGNPLDDVLHLSTLIENNEYGDVDSRQRQVSARRETRHGKWLRSYSLRLLEESWDEASTKYNNSYLLPGFSLSRSDRWGSLVDPRHGFSQLYQVEAAGDELGSDLNLLRLTADFTYILTPLPRHRLVGRLELGAAYLADADRPRLAPSLNFFAGGARSIRGYGYQAVGNEIKVTRANGTTQTLVVGGDRLLTGSMEYQYYFTDTWRGAVFVDAGDAFDADQFDLKVGPGFGVHYLSPVGAVRVEAAYGLDEQSSGWRLHLNIGAEF